MTAYGPVTSSACMTPAICAICRATSAALPTSVWTRMYACTMASSWDGLRLPPSPATVPQWFRPISPWEPVIQLIELVCVGYVPAQPPARLDQETRFTGGGGDIAGNDGSVADLGEWGVI